LLADLGKTDEAAAGLKKLFNGKNDRETWLQLVQVYEKGRRFDDMARAINEAEKLSLTNDDKEVIHFLRGAMFEKMKKVDESVAEFRKLLALNPKSASALNYLGYMWVDRNVHLAEATSMIEQALEQEPNNGAYLDSLGWAYFRQGRLDDAEKKLRLALERTGNDPTIHDHLGDVLAKQGKLKDAVTEWARSLELYQIAAPADRDEAEISKVRKKLDSARVRLAQERQN
jgi:Tfp pilus assembly protein PilF